MNIRFYNAKILAMHNSSEIIDGELWVEEKRIVYVGENKTSNEIAWDREIDVEGNLILPGFKDAHTHSAMTFLRSYADGLELSDWLQQKVFPMEDKLTFDDVEWLTKLAILEYLSTGVTACFDMYLYPEANIKAAIETGFRITISCGMNDYFYTIDEVEKWYCKYNNYHELVKFQLGLHSEYTARTELVDQMAQLAHKYQAPVFLHCSETEEEVKACIQRNGTTPIEYLNEHGIFDYGGGGYHCVHVNHRELQIMAQKHVYAITNPASNLKLGSGIAPIRDFIKYNIPVAIGTDGAASNNALDMFREMYLTSVLSNILVHDALTVDPRLVIQMATVNGARAMGLTDCDILAEGKYADLVILDLHKPNMQPENNIIKNIVYSGSKYNVKMTMVNGKILYENGTYHIGTEEKVIYEKANQIIQRIKKEI